MPSELVYPYRFSSIIRQSCFPSKQYQNQDLSYKTDLDLRYCLGRVTFVLKQNFTDLVIRSHSRE